MTEAGKGENDAPASPARTLVVSDQVPQRAFVGVTVLLFIISAAVTVFRCNSMSALRGMPMPGGWTMSMAWMRMPGQTWEDAAASFVGMWMVMMAAMMMPSLAPMLWRYRQSIGSADETLRGRQTALVGLGYFFVWTLFGLAVFPVGVAAAAIEMEQPVLARAIPIAVGLVVFLAGALQFTKLAESSPEPSLFSSIAGFREQPMRARSRPSRPAGGAWREWLREYRDARWGPRIEG
jgi:predicted metal-binding membrane protein